MHMISGRWHRLKSRRSKLVDKCRNAPKIARIKTEEKRKENPKDYDFILVHSFCWQELSKNLICSECKTRSISVKFSKEKGCDILILFVCDTCECVLSECYFSPKAETEKKVNSYTVSRKLVDGVNAIGQGYAALERMCMVLNMHCMSSRSFYNHFDRLSKEVNDLENKVLESARNEI